MAAVYFVGGRRGVAAGGQSGFPQEFAGRFVVGVEFPVVVRRADEEQSARSDYGAAVVLAAGVVQALWRRAPGYSPKGIFQAYSPVFRSIAFSVPQGGAMAG